MKLSDAEIPSLLFAEQASDPATPATGFWRIYLKAGGFYVIDDAGAVTGPFGSVAGAISATDTDASSWDFVIDEDDMASDSATKLPTQQSVKAYVDGAVGGIGPGSGSYVGRVFQTLTNKTSFAGTGAEQWGTEEATFDDASLPNPAGVIVYASLMGYVLNTTSTGSLVVYIEISIDGGSTWNTGRQLLYRKESGLGSDRVAIVADHQITGTVTGDIQARVMTSCSTGGAAAYDLTNGAIALEVISNP